jgi:serine/threonine protein kinase
MISAFQDRENVYLLLDYLSGGDLRYYINRKKNFT